MKKTAVSAVMSLIVLSAFANNEIANAEKFVKENKCKNLITNGSFELFAKKNKIPGWWPWKDAKSQGEVNWEQNSGVNDSGAAVISGGNILISQDIKNVKPGEKYLIKVTVQKNSEASKASVSVRSKANRKWCPGIKSTAIPVKLSQADKWESAVGIVTVQPGVDTLCIMLSASNLKDEDSEIIFDNVEAYKIK